MLNLTLFTIDEMEYEMKIGSHRPLNHRRLRQTT